jgi:hypothetical protein
LPNNWNFLSTFDAGNVLRAGNGTYVVENVTTTGRISFMPQVAIQLFVSAHWDIAPDDAFTLGYIDSLRYYELYKTYISGIPGIISSIVFGQSGLGQLTTTMVFSPTQLVDYLSDSD